MIHPKKEYPVMQTHCRMLMEGDTTKASRRYSRERPSQRQMLTATALPRSAEGEQPCLDTPMESSSTWGSENTASSGP